MVSQLFLSPENAVQGHEASHSSCLLHSGLILLFFCCFFFVFVFFILSGLPNKEFDKLLLFFFFSDICFPLPNMCAK